MKTLEIYRNFGALTAEKRYIYTFGNPNPTATTWDKLTVKIPDDWDAYENPYGETIILTPWGQPYTPNELLIGNNAPEFCAVDKNFQQHCIPLRILKIEKH